MGTAKQSRASKRQWSKLSKRQRQLRMRPLSDARWKGKAKKTRSEHARAMALARWGKRK